MKNIFFETIMRIERLHRLFLAITKQELEAINVHDINNVQCFILYNIGKNKLTVGEIKNRGYYLGSNVTYNLKKMIDLGYILQKTSPHDRRSSYIHLSEKGLVLYSVVEKILEKNAKNLIDNSINQDSVNQLNKTLNKIESFCAFVVNHNVLSGPQ